jgi:hypothetical protein
MNREDILQMGRQAGAFIELAQEKDLLWLERFAALVASAEREACAEIADRLPRIYRETEEAHYRLSPEPFKPSNFGFDFAELKQAEAITHAIRARGQA